MAAFQAIIFFLEDTVRAVTAVGIKEIPLDFGKKLAKTGCVFHPIAEHAAVYDKQFKKYKELYKTLKPLF